MLASKYNEVSRIYPAEVVRQVSEWGEAEFEILFQGQIEEYILNVMDFDLMLLTPVDFLDFYLGVWDSCLPVKSCIYHNLSDSKINKKSLLDKVKLYANQVLKSLVTDLCGHSVSIKYLPSMVAMSALQMA